MLRPSKRGVTHFTGIGIARRGAVPRVVIQIGGGSDSCFLTAIRADVLVFAEGNFDGGEQRFFVRAKALGVGDVTDVGTELAVGPQEIADGGEQLFT